jgi:hypothetical protein
MLSSCQKIWIWSVIVCFALLQAISPFIHGHIATASSLQGSGLHMHAEDVEFLSTDYYAVGDVHSAFEHFSISNQPMPLYVVGVDKALVKDLAVWVLPLLAFILFVLMPIRLANAKTQFVERCSSPSRLLRERHSPRAPPQA